MIFLRALGMAISWVGFSLAFTLVFLSMRAVLAVGGFCAEGGPYEIAVHCPAGVEGFLPLGIYLGLGTVAVGLFLARSFGAQLVLWAWPILFIGLGYNFVDEGFFNGFGLDPIGIGLGAMFVIMGAVPLVIVLRQKGAIRSLLAGGMRLDGEVVGVAGFGAKRAALPVSTRWMSYRGYAQPGVPGYTEPTEPDAAPPTMRPLDYVVLVPLWVAETAFGVWLAVTWFFA